MGMVTMKCKCGKHMSKLYIHHNQHHSKGQWEHVGYLCVSCNTIIKLEG